jgi:hypothetical protein
MKLDEIEAESGAGPQFIPIMRATDMIKLNANERTLQVV